MKNKLNERKQTNRNVEQDRSAGPKHATNNNRNEQPQRFIYWDDEFSEEIRRVRKSSGRFTDRYFERDED